MKIVMSYKEQERLIDIAIKEGVKGFSEFHLWLQENRDRILDMFQPSYQIVYGGDEEY